MAGSSGLSKTAVVEKALDRLLGEAACGTDPMARMKALLAQIDRIPDRPDAFDPLEWDANGLPR